MSTVKTAVGTFTWHDHMSDDAATAQEFYTQLLGWEIEIWKTGEFDYPMIKANGQQHGGFGPAQGGASAHWLGHVVVEDVDETVSKAEAAGGKLLGQPLDIPEVGRMAVIQDPQGAAISAFSPLGEPGTSGGTFIWDELMTTDVDGAKSFYREIFGWTSSEMDMGEGRTYTLFARADGTNVAGCLAAPPGAEGQPHWYPYLATEDADATTAKATELGATVYMEPTSMPDVGRFSVLADPSGATFGLLQPSTS